jgi:hypothetical protein
MRKTLLLCSLPTLLLAHVCLAQTPAVQRLLVPIYLPGPLPGAYGASWVSELTILNTGESIAHIDNFGPTSPVQPSLPEPIPPGVAIPGDGIRELQGNGIPAAVLIISSEFQDQFAFQLRVRDVSRAADRWGTWLPVVSQSAFAAGQMHLLNVPLDARYRLMLRVYSLDANDGQEVRLRVFGMQDDVQPPYTIQPDEFISETMLRLQSGTASQPAYAELANVATPDGVHSHVRFVVEPVGSFHIWALVSITNNTTQEVAIVVPNSLGS